MSFKLELKFKSHYFISTIIKTYIFEKINFKQFFKFDYESVIDFAYFSSYTKYLLNTKKTVFYTRQQ